MPSFKDLTGKRFGRLLVIELSAKSGKTKCSHWLCLCDCGTKKIVSIANLGKNTNSCGCLRNTQGGLTRKHPLWATWSSMHQRCRDVKNKDYFRYGGRGIKVCKRWRSFPN